MFLFIYNVEERVLYLIICIFVNLNNFCIVLFFLFFLCNIGNIKLSLVYLILFLYDLIVLFGIWFWEIVLGIKNLIILFLIWFCEIIIGIILVFFLN